MARDHRRKWLGSSWMLWCLIGFTICLGLGVAATFWSQRSDEFANGYEHFLHGRWEEAVAAFDRVIAENPRHLRAVFYRAASYEKQNKAEKAFEGYAKAIQLHEEQAELPIAASDRDIGPLTVDLTDAYLNRGKHYLDGEKGKIDSAIADFTKAIRLDPRRADAYCGRGQAFLAKRFFELAIDDLTEAIRLAPNGHESFCSRARAHLASGQFLLAIVDCRRAIQLDPKCAEAFRTLGTATLSSSPSQAAEAVAYYRQAIDLKAALKPEVTPQLAEATFQQAMNLAKAGKPADAEIAFEEAGELDAKYVGLHQEYFRKNATAAIGPRDYAAMKLIVTVPEATILCNQAFALLRQSQYDAAIGLFTKVVLNDAKNAEAWYGRGCAFLEKDSPDTAIEDFNEAIRLKSDYPEALSQRGLAYTMLGDCQRGVQDGTYAIRLKPDFALAYFYRAEAYAKGFKYDRALADLKEAVRLDPSLEAQSRAWFADVYRGRGLGSANRNEFVKAFADFDESIRLDPTNARYYQARGLTHYKLTQWNGAIHDLSKAIELDPNLTHELQPALTDARQNRNATPIRASASGQVGL